MEKLIMKNGIKIVYEKVEGDITSFSMAFNAGAIVEEKNQLGLAHVVEHMVFKGTKTRDEEEINELCDEYFGFNNAMTNYPYVVYYATCLSEDFHKAFQLYSDIVINPIFPEEGFKEEIDVICQELREWKDDLAQYCEDELFYNSFNSRRIKNLIIGTEESVRSFKRKDVVEFYNKHYIPESCVISVVSSLDFKEIVHRIEDIFGKWKREHKYEKVKDTHENIKHTQEKHAMELSIDEMFIPLYEDNNFGTFVKLKKDMETAKIQYIFTIHNLKDEEVKALRVFNAYFGEGTSSLLYQKIRTENGLAYDITSSIKNETGIKLFTIYVGTSKDKISQTINLINQQIQEVKSCKGIFARDRINKLCKSIKLKRSLGLEQSIRLSLNLAVYGIMYGEPLSLYEQIKDLDKVDENLILSTINKVLNSPSIQVIEPIK
ncbi:pitrilysin family protein [Clostridium sp. KNHs214]|uniref:M16 family metallopeptidase n=1 Tax=Clostridium sp. KNHs214 TaxID=1540257 RepID=UPI000552C86D|nr:pitrilysin family protein [Clostridium sp. KNHs214]